jgi:hypothetical protein
MKLGIKGASFKGYDFWVADSLAVSFLLLEKIDRIPWTIDEFSSARDG